MTTHSKIGPPRAGPLSAPPHRTIALNNAGTTTELVEDAIADDKGTVSGNGSLRSSEQLPTATD